MTVFELRRELLVPRDAREVFDHFADAGNLDDLTPAWLRFRILTPLPIAMRCGTEIRYRLRWRGIPFLWLTEITAWEPPQRFVDEQRRGPYRLWVHEHTFEIVDEGTLIRDQVRYCPLGGRTGNYLVRPDLERIFDYRHERLLDLFQSRARLQPCHRSASTNETR